MNISVYAFLVVAALVVIVIIALLSYGNRCSWCADNSCPRCDIQCPRCELPTLKMPELSCLEQPWMCGALRKQCSLFCFYCPIWRCSDDEKRQERDEAKQRVSQASDRALSMRSHETGSGDAARDFVIEWEDAKRSGVLEDTDRAWMTETENNVQRVLQRIQPSLVEELAHRNHQGECMPLTVSVRTIMGAEAEVQVLPCDVMHSVCCKAMLALGIDSSQPQHLSFGGEAQHDFAVVFELGIEEAAVLRVIAGPSTADSPEAQDRAEKLWNAWYAGIHSRPRCGCFRSNRVQHLDAMLIEEGGLRAAPATLATTYTAPAAATATPRQAAVETNNNDDHVVNVTEYGNAVFGREQWQCQVCTFVNSNAMPQCEMCEAARE